MKKNEYFVIVGGATTLIFFLLFGRPGGLFRASLRCGFFGQKDRKELNPAHPWRSHPLIQDVAGLWS